MDVRANCVPRGACFLRRLFESSLIRRFHGNWLIEILRFHGNLQLFGPEYSYEIFISSIIKPPVVSGLRPYSYNLHIN